MFEWVITDVVFDSLCYFVMYYGKSMMSSLVGFVGIGTRFALVEGETGGGWSFFLRNLRMHIVL